MGTPDGLKVVLATVHPALADVPAESLPEKATLSSLPWVVLQLQSLDMNDPPCSG